MVVKTDRKDARGIAQLLRMGWFRPAHAKQSQGCDAHMRFLAGDPKQPTIITATNSGIMYPLARNCGIVPHRRRLAHSMLIASIILEAAVAILAILAARKGKPYVYGLAFTFGAYVLYDLARFPAHGCAGRYFVRAVSARNHQRADRRVGLIQRIAPDGSVP